MTYIPYNVKEPAAFTAPALFTPANANFDLYAKNRQTILGFTAYFFLTFTFLEKLP